MSCQVLFHELRRSDPDNEYASPWKLHVLCKNACSNGEIRLAAVLAEASDIAWDIICFSETRAADADMMLDGGHGYICCNCSLKYAGVAILVHSRHKDNIKTVASVSGRLLYVDIAIQNSCRFIAVYFPHAGYPNEELEDMYKKLRTCLTDADRIGVRCIVGATSLLHYM